METVLIILVLMVGCVIIGVFAEWLRAMVMPIGKIDLFEKCIGNVRESLPPLREDILKAIDANLPLSREQKLLYEAYMKRVYELTVEAYVDARWPNGDVA